MTTSATVASQLEIGLLDTSSSGLLDGLDRCYKVYFKSDGAFH
jgi:hypothetical protein